MDLKGSKCCKRARTPICIEDDWNQFCQHRTKSRLRFCRAFSGGGYLKSKPRARRLTPGYNVFSASRLFVNLSLQTRCNFQRPRRKTNALTIAKEEKAIGIAMKTPVAPALK
jgi:hypothetical protein